MYTWIDTCRRTNALTRSTCERSRARESETDRQRDGETERDARTDAWMERRAKERCRKPARAEVNRTNPTPATALSDKFVNVSSDSNRGVSTSLGPWTACWLARPRARVSVCVSVSLCVYVCVHACPRERGREGGREGESRKDTDTDTDLHGHEKSGAQHKRPIAPAFRPRRYHKKAQTCALLPDRPSVILQGAELPLAVDGQRIFHAPAHVHRHLRVNVMVD